MTKLNKRKCVVCREVFQKTQPLQNCCGILCSIQHAKNLREKKEAKQWKVEKKQLKEKLKTKSDYEKELEVVVNAFIRERDRDLPCISCKASPGTYKLTAGHFYPAGSYRNLRFNEDNIHGQCWFNCNKNRHGNLQEYRPRLVLKIGRDKIEELDRLARVPRHYTIPELIILKEEYKERIRQMKR